MADIILSCPDGYQLAFAKDSKEDRCCFCCVRRTSRSPSSARWDLGSAPWSGRVRAGHRGTQNLRPGDVARPHS